MASEPIDLGWLDADLFIHPFFNNAESPTCRSILYAIQAGSAKGTLDEVTVHEILYVLGRLWSDVPEPERRQTIAQYVTGFIVLENVDVRDRPVTLEALRLWGSGQAVSYGDAR